MNKENPFSLIAIVIAVAVITWVALALTSRFINNEPEAVTQELTCGIITPNGMVGTIKGEVKNGTITDFGIIKHKDGLYIPTVNEVCLLTEKDD